MTWAFSIWTSSRAWQEASPPWKARLLYVLFAGYACLALDVIL
jgi:hypothetical protein